MCFKGVDYKASLFVNGNYCGSHEGFFAPFEFEISKKAKIGQNTILVKVENDYTTTTTSDDKNNSIQGNKIYAASGPGYDDPVSGWHHCPAGMGIYQDCFLESRSTLHINDIFVRPHPEKSQAEVWIEVNNYKEYPVDMKLKISVYGQNFSETVVEDSEYIPVTTHIPGVGDLAKPTDWEHKKLKMGYGPNLMKIPILIILNLGLLALFIYLFRNRELLSYHHKGRWWLTWLAIGVITLMDEFTSIFYVPAEAYRFIGLSAIVFIAVTSLLIRFLSTRLTEIAEILERHHLIGGGVYSFSYLVLGPMVSFVAISSIMVDYILTACISAVSAIANITSFFNLSEPVKMILVLGIIWAVAGLNIIGIRENARFTFMIFVAAAFVLLNLIVSGLISLDSHSLGQLHLSVKLTTEQLQTGTWSGDYSKFISHIAFCILAYSGVESVLQTAGLVRTWQEIRKAYLFLGLTVGIVTPLVAALALSCLPAGLWAIQDGLLLPVLPTLASIAATISPPLRA